MQSQQEDEEQAAAREREAEERRQQEKQAILDQRAARRKSMANRRVSFAPEATLHTWNVVELADDSTTSSGSTRRQSSVAASPSPGPDSVSSDPPSTPPAQVEETLVEASPAHQRDLHQKKRRRRSSGIPPMNFNNPDDEADLSSSPFSGSSAAGESSPVAVDESINSDDDSDDNDTAMSIEDITGQSGVSVGSESSTVSSLDKRLAAAANQAGTRGIAYDENGDDVSMELATGTVTAAFQPWAKQAGNMAQNLTSIQDQENVNPFSPAFKAQMAADTEQVSAQEDEGTQDMSMDVTAAVGGIVSQTKQSPSKSRRRSVAASRRRSSVARRRSSGEVSMVEEDETMELTTVGGGIIPQAQTAPTEHEEATEDDEEMTMEFTSVVGGVLSGQSQPQPLSADTRRESIEPSGMDETMDMTAAIGGILPPIEEQTEPLTEDEETQAMDVTKAMGAILPSHLNSATKSRAKQLMENETDAGQLDSSPFQERTAPVSPPKPISALPDHISTSVASETGSPSLAMKPRLSGRRTPVTRQSTTPKAVATSTPTKASSAKVGTPTKQMTPQPSRPETPEKTPIMTNVTHRGASPKKLFKAEIKAKASPASAQSAERKSLFSQDAETGAHTPSIVLAPKLHQHLRRRSSGVGIDKEGLGSPRISAILDRRGSIGEDARLFVPETTTNRGVRFDDPKAIEEQIDAERDEEERRESGRFIMEQEADMQQDDENATLQLKEMIQSMTPKKNKLKGRKSLHVGAARGILGKRPVELDLEDEDAEGTSTPKRLKVIENQASPVKKIHLPAPPSKAETTGRLTRANRKSLEETTANVTPSLRMSGNKTVGGDSPRHTGRFKDTPVDPTVARPTSFEDKLDNVMDAVDANVVQIQQDEAEEVVEEKIHLQDFLNMTNIHFMELNTTKRRHTIAPSADMANGYGGHIKTASLGDCVVASTTTLPLLELYQHACRELKSYISSGRRIIRSIEQETLEEQPPLFREYLDAKPDVKMVMDNQFRNGKANARLQSKGGWYAWRSQLVDGLKGGLESIRAGMNEDASQISKQETMIQKVLPALERRRAELEDEEKKLQKRKIELESEDHEALREARIRLSKLEAEMSQEQGVLNGLEREMQDKETALSDAAELKSEFLSQIEEAERVQEECRGVSLKDVRESKSKVEDIEQRTGWKILSAEEDEDYSESNGPALTMRYKDSLRLFFYPAAFQLSAAQQNRRRSSKSRGSTSLTPSAPISLTYSPDSDLTGEDNTIPDLPTEKRFMLQFLRSQLHAQASQPKGTVTPLSLLNLIKNGWDLISRVTEEIRLLSIMGVTFTSILGDETLGVKSTVLLPNGKGRVDIEFQTVISLAGDRSEEIGTRVSVDVKAIYGNVVALLEKKGEKVLEALGKEIQRTEMGEGSWVGAVRGFEEWVGLQKGNTGGMGMGMGIGIPTPVRKTPKRK